MYKGLSHISGLRGTLLQYPYTYIRIYTSAKSARFARLIFSIGLRQAKIVDGIRGDSCICNSIEWKDRRFRPRLVGAIFGAWKAEDEVWKACRFRY